MVEFGVEILNILKIYHNLFRAMKILIDFYQYSMKQIRNTCFYALIILMMVMQESTQNDFPFSANEKYSYSGKAILDINQSIVTNGGADWSKGFNITVVYPRTYNFNLNISSTAVMGDFGYQYLPQGIYLVVKTVETTQSSLKIQIKNYNASKIQRLSISYFVFLHEYTDAYNFANYGYNFSYGYSPKALSNNNLTWYSTDVSCQSFNNSGEERIIILLAGIMVIGGQTNTYDLDFSAKLKNSTTIIVYIKSYSPQFTYLYSILFQVFLYNPSFVKDTKISYQFYAGTVSNKNSSNGSFVSDGHKIKIFNTLYGLSGFSVSYRTSMGLEMQFFSDTQVRAFSGVTLNLFVYGFVSIYSKYCDYSQPYYEELSSICYQQCPNKTNSITQLKCVCSDINGSILNNSVCFQGSLTTINSSNSSQTWKFILIGVIIGVSILIAVIVVIYLFWKQKKKKKHTTLQNDDIRVQIVFDTPNGYRQKTPSTGNKMCESTNKIVSIQGEDFQRLPADIDGNQIIIKVDPQNIKYKGQPPAFHAIAEDKKNIQNQNDVADKMKDQNLSAKDKGANQKGSSANISDPIFHSVSPEKPSQNKKPQNVEPYSKASQNINQQQQWVSCPKYDDSHMCTICRNSKSYLQTSCGHYFHAQCLMLQLQNRSVCPICRKQLDANVKYYCSRCGEKQKNMILKMIVDPSVMNKLCDDCSQIPY